MPVCLTEDSPAGVSAAFHTLHNIVSLLHIRLLLPVLSEIEGPGCRLGVRIQSGLDVELGLIQLLI